MALGHLGPELSAVVPHTVAKLVLLQHLHSGYKNLR